MQKIFMVVFLATTVVFGGLYFSQSPEIKQVPVENPLNKNLEKDLKLSQGEVEKLKKEIARLNSQINLLETAQLDRQKSISTDPKTGEKKVEVTSTNESPFMKMFQDPKIQDMMKKRRNQMIEGRYKYLFDKLNLDEDQKAKLIELMGERGTAAMAMGMKMRMLESEEEKQAARDERDLAEQEADAKIADLLGDQYETYSDYNKKRNEYREVEDLNRRLGEAKLSEDQTDKLATIMNDTNSSFQFSNEKVNESRWAVYSLNSEERAQYAKEVEERDAIILKESESVLSADQLEVLKKEQERDRERITRTRGFGRDRGGRGGR